MQILFSTGFPLCISLVSLISIFILIFCLIGIVQCRINVFNHINFCEKSVNVIVLRPISSSKNLFGEHDVCFIWKSIQIPRILKQISHIKRNQINFQQISFQILITHVSREMIYIQSSKNIQFVFIAMMWIY